MSNLVPQAMSKDEFAAVLRDILERVEAGDSYEGNIEYLMPGEDDYPSPADIPPGVDFMVRGVYRVGNLMGQGGTRMIGTVPQ